MFSSTPYFSVSENLGINNLLYQVDDIFSNPLFSIFELNRTPATMPCWEVFDP
jgi:hypothetical protein